MDPVSLIFGAAIASVFWIGISPSRRRWADQIRPDEGVWIVSQDAEVDNQILGVFATEPEAAAHADAVAGDWPDGTVAYAQYPMGWDGNGSRYSG